MINEIDIKENQLSQQSRINNKIIYLPLYMNRKKNKYNYTVRSKNKDPNNTNILLFFKRNNSLRNL